MAAQKKFAAYPEAVTLVFPPHQRLGQCFGIVFELQDRVGRTPQDLAALKQKFMQAMAQRSELTGHVFRFSFPPFLKSTWTLATTKLERWRRSGK